MDLKEGVIISDAGSTKSAIVDAAEQYLDGKSVRFVGAHPMAGSHKTGAASADVNLFENAYYIFTPSSLTSPDTLEEMRTCFQVFMLALSRLMPRSMIV